jgi:hypothetical protein
MPIQVKPADPVAVGVKALVLEAPGLLCLIYDALEGVFQFVVVAHLKKMGGQTGLSM